ncbi:MAG: helix-turn-helix transcriptional regulator [Conchiformibius sp.]|nr:helix-turn-helix transcriptional regulator [Conchiformibius sp.]
MSVHDKIRLMRELNRWSQDEMAKKLNMSLNGYAKIERGETKLYLEKLNQIAQIFNVDLLELVSSNNQGMVFFTNENKGNYAVAYAENYYGDHPNGRNDAELEKLQLIITHQNEIIEQKNNELAALKKLIALLEQQSPPQNTLK